MKVFYDLSRQSMECTEFIQYYNKFYYTDYPAKIKGVRQNSRFIEKRIEEILKNGIKENIDVIHILALKMAKVSHLKSEQAQKFVYHSDWKDAYKLENDHEYNINGLNLKFYNYQTKKQEKLYISGLVAYVLEESRLCCKWTNEHAMIVLDEMKDKVKNGIGTVYLITLVYYMSKGEFPIYDQYADRAVKAISEGESPWADLQVHTLPPRQDGLGKKISGKDSYYISTYRERIDNIFGYDKYKANRDIDRALWVYGHLFSKKTNELAKS